MLWFRKALTPNFFSRQHRFDEAALVLLTTNVQQQRSGPAIGNRIEHDRRIMAFHDPRGDTLIFRMHAIAAIFGGPRHPEIARLINLTLPIAEEIKLLIRRHFHKGQGQHETGVPHRVFGEPRVALLFKGGEFLRAWCAHGLIPLSAFNWAIK